MHHIPHHQLIHTLLQSLCKGDNLPEGILEQLRDLIANALGVAPLATPPLAPKARTEVSVPHELKNRLNVLQATLMRLRPMANPVHLDDALHHAGNLRSVLELMTMHPSPRYDLLFNTLIHESVEHCIELATQACIPRSRSHDKAALAKTIDFRDELLAEFDDRTALRYPFDHAIAKSSITRLTRADLARYMNPPAYNADQPASPSPAKEIDKGLRLLMRYLERLEDYVTPRG